MNVIAALVDLKRICK